MRRLIRWLRHYYLAILRSDLEYACRQFREYHGDINRRIARLERELMLEHRP